MRFQIIANFYELPDDIIDIDLPEIYYENEARFVTMILNCMEEDSIKKLAKLSVCQHAKSQAEAIQWLIDRNGKYFFNYGVNNDPDTKSLSEFKIFYLDQRKRLREKEDKEKKEKEDKEKKEKEDKEKEEKEDKEKEDKEKKEKEDKEKEEKDKEKEDKEKDKEKKPRQIRKTKTNKKNKFIFFNFNS